MKPHIFERACPLYQEGALTPILREICPCKKKTPNSCPVNRAVTGKLLIVLS